MRFVVGPDPAQLDAIPSPWPAFMEQDPISRRYWSRIGTTFADFQLLAYDDDDRSGGDAPVGRIMAVPFAWTGEPLPARGWDAILERAFADHAAGRRPTAVSLVEARVAPDRLGTGLSQHLLVAIRQALQRTGVRDLFGPVRPTGKAAQPHTPMQDYVDGLRPDGLPVDPWLRVHARVGGHVVAVCPLSMTIPGTLEQWRGWTGLPFDRSGPTVVPGAFVPVHVDLEQDHAVYVEPNVWVHHRL